MPEFKRDRKYILHIVLDGDFPQSPARMEVRPETLLDLKETISCWNDVPGAAQIAKDVFETLLITGFKKDEQSRIFPALTWKLRHPTGFWVYENGKSFTNLDGPNLMVLRDAIEVLRFNGPTYGPFSFIFSVRDVTDDPSEDIVPL